MSLIDWCTFKRKDRGRVFTSILFWLQIVSVEWSTVNEHESGIFYYTVQNLCVVFILLDYPNLSITMAGPWSVSGGSHDSVSNSDHVNKLGWFDHELGWYCLYLGGYLVWSFSLQLYVWMKMLLLLVYSGFVFSGLLIYPVCSSVGVSSERFKENLEWWWEFFSICKVKVRIIFCLYCFLFIWVSLFLTKQKISVKELS